jgi:hypothetical protein
MLVIAENVFRLRSISLWLWIRWHSMRCQLQIKWLVTQGGCSLTVPRTRTYSSLGSSGYYCYTRFMYSSIIVPRTRACSSLRSSRKLLSIQLNCVLLDECAPHQSMLLAGVFDGVLFNWIPDDEVARFSKSAFSLVCVNDLVPSKWVLGAS